MVLWEHLDDTYCLWCLLLWVCSHTQKPRASFIGSYPVIRMFSSDLMLFSRPFSAPLAMFIFSFFHPFCNHRPSCPLIISHTNSLRLSSSLTLNHSYPLHFLYFFRTKFTLFSHNWEIFIHSFNLHSYVWRKNTFVVVPIYCLLNAHTNDLTLLFPSS